MLHAPPNPMLAKLARREAALGVLVFSSDPAVTEMAGGAGFDLVLIDTEHAALGLPDIVAHVRAAQCAGVSCWVRVGRYDTAEIGRILDAGAQGIMFPHYGLHPEATDALAAMRYAPTGARPTCTGMRGTAYGIADFAAYATRANQETMAVGLVEDREVVDQIDRVLDQCPLQAVMPGGAVTSPRRSASMGKRGTRSSLTPSGASWRRPRLDHSSPSACTSPTSSRWPTCWRCRRTSTCSRSTTRSWHERSRTSTRPGWMASARPRRVPLPPGRNSRCDR